MKLDPHAWGSARRRALARYPALRWLAVTVMSLSVGWLVHAHVTELDAARDAWGDRRQVAVASGDHSPGDVITFDLVDVPNQLIAPTALDTVGPGARARQHLADGEVLVAVDLTNDDGLTALASDNTVVIALTDRSVAAARVGDRVAVFAEGLALTGEAVITHIDQDIAFVAVPVGDAPLIAHAAATGTASLGFIHS